jgi:hypothetical protein
MQRQLLPATDENKGLVSEYVQQLAAFGGTDHFRALVAGLAFRPDVLVLLTDGGLPELNEGQINEITRYARQTQIHTIQFGFGPMQTADNFLRRLAEINNGTYKYIDVQQWRRPAFE